MARDMFALPALGYSSLTMLLTVVALRDPERNAVSPRA
jgi:hypothetical protein